MLVEVWSDVVCPWCYLGKRRLAAALERFDGRAEVEVRWRAFELDPAAPPVREGTAAEHLAATYGMAPAQVEASWARLTELGRADGIDYRLPDTKGGSSFDAHRLVALAAQGGDADALVERFFRAYFTDGLPLGDREVLARVAVEAGLDAGEVEETLASARFADEVRADERTAAELGVQGVPFFAFDRRYGVSGAQSADLLRQALEAAAA